jgi:hypothetical protein
VFRALIAGVRPCLPCLLQGLPSLESCLFSLRLGGRTHLSSKVLREIGLHAEPRRIRGYLRTHYRTGRKTPAQEALTLVFKTGEVWQPQAG